MILKGITCSQCGARIQSIPAVEPGYTDHGHLRPAFPLQRAPGSDRRGAGRDRGPITWPSRRVAGRRPDSEVQDVAQAPVLVAGTLTVAAQTVEAGAAPPGAASNAEAWCLTFPPLNTAAPPATSWPR